jgi:hypothetical protein
MRKKRDKERRNLMLDAGIRIGMFLQLESKAKSLKPNIEMVKIVREYAIATGCWNMNNREGKRRCVTGRLSKLSKEA